MGNPLRPLKGELWGLLNQRCFFIAGFRLRVDKRFNEDVEDKIFGDGMKRRLFSFRRRGRVMRCQREEYLLSFIGVALLYSTTLLSNAVSLTQTHSPEGAAYLSDGHSPSKK
jgi:hypothetical protein